MQFPRIKFIWGGARVIRGRWYFGLFGLYDRVEGQREDGLAINLYGLFAWGAALALIAYFAAATVLYQLWNRNPYNLLGYGDALLYPVRRSALEAKRGQAYLNQGTDLWRQRKPDDAARLLRAGLQRVPYDLRARTILAQYYVLRRSRPLARETLAEGLGPDYPGRTYLRTLFALCEQDEDFALMARTCARYRTRLAGDETLSERRWLQAQEFAALTADGRHEDALRLASADANWNEMASEERVMALLALRRGDEAIRVLADWRARPGADLRRVARLEAHAFREARRFDDMERALAELQRLLPNQPEALVYGVVQRAMAGRDAAARAALEDFLFRGAKTSVELRKLAEPLEEIGALGLLERCAAAAAERGYPKEPFQVLLVQAHLRRGEAVAAQQILERMAPLPESAPSTGEGATTRVWREWMQALVGAATSPGDVAQLRLLEFMRRGPWPMLMFRRTIETLRFAGRLETERDVATMAARTFPASAWAQARQREIVALLAARKPTER